MQQFLVFLIFMSTSLTLSASNIAERYLSDYSAIAVSEMERTGIPASIKLAQALLESDWGRSELATQANNHFGIKCGNNWAGKTFYKEDDDRDARGRLIKSCFRVFEDPYKSFIAHSEFLRDPNKEHRYGRLFKLRHGDYKSWAKGLRESGYATDPKYPEKLIDIIERYQLYTYDDDHNHIQEVVNELNANKKPVEKRSPEVTASNSTSHAAYLKFNEINRCRVVINNKPQSIQAIANKVGEPLDKILAYNEMYYYADQLINPGAIIYLEKKKRSYRGEEMYHVVQEGETMETISQMYGLKLRSLYAKNRMPRAAKTVPGEKLSLSKTVNHNERPKFILEDDSRSHEFLFDEE